MSLVITSSNQDKYDESSVGDGITRSFSYQNNMRSPLVIEPNSEIAVQSVKTTRQDNIVISNDTQVGLYFGKTLTASVGIEKSPQAVTYSNVRRGTYTKNSFAAELELGFQDSYRNTYVNASFVSVEVKRNGSSTNFFEGYTITYQQMAGVVGNGSNNRSASAISCINDTNKTIPFGEYIKTDDFVYVAASGRITKGTNTLKSAVGILTDFPLSSTNGSCVFNLNTSSYPTSFIVGLTRGIAPTLIAPLSLTEKTITFRPEDFYDYCLVWEGTGSPLRVFQYVYGVGMKEVTPSSGVVQSASMTKAAVQQVGFERNGEKIKVKYFNKETGVWATYVTEGTMKPAGLSCEMLYPKMTLSSDNSGGVVECEHFSGVNNAWTPKYTDNRFYGLRNEIDGRRIDDDIDERTSGITSSGAAGSYSYVGLNASNGVDSTITLVIGKSTKFAVPGVNLPNFGSMRELLGFQEITTIDQVPMATISDFNKVKFVSSATPVPGPLSNLFVRLNNLPFNSFNANKGSISKILYPLPRIDNAGKSFGSLYFEANERTYLKINNATRVTMTEIAVDIVDINEQLADDLSGNTIVIFHIRKAL